MLLDGSGRDAFRSFWTIGFGDVDDEGAAHEGLVVEDLDGALGLLDLRHGDEAIALRAVGASVIDDIDITDRADAFEEIFDIVLGGIIGKVTDVEAARINIRGIGGLAAGLTITGWPLGASRGRFPRLAFFPPLAALPWLTPVAVFSGLTPLAFFSSGSLARDALGLTGHGSIEAEKLFNFLPEGKRLGCRAAPTGAAPISTLVPATLATLLAIAAVALAITVAIAVAVPITVAITVVIPVIVRSRG